MALPWEWRWSGTRWNLPPVSGCRSSVRNNRHFRASGVSGIETIASTFTHTIQHHRDVNSRYSPRHNTPPPPPFRLTMRDCAQLRGPGQKRMSCIAVQRESVCRHPLAHKVHQWISGCLFGHAEFSVAFFGGSQIIRCTTSITTCFVRWITMPWCLQVGTCKCSISRCPCKGNPHRCDYGTKHQMTSPALGSSSQADLS